MKLNIFVYVHMWPPLHCAGSEVTVHAVMRELVKRGHSVTTIADQTPRPYEYEGVKVLSLPQTGVKYQTVKELAKDADILVTHLDCTSHAMQLHLDIQKPLVHFVHNHRQLGPHPGHSVPPNKAQLVVFNSQWIADWQMYKDEPWPGSGAYLVPPLSVVIPPIVEPERYRCKPGNKITLCNPTAGKGADTIYALAEAMPDYEFLVVEGIYGEQIAPPNLSDAWCARHPNIEFMKNSPDFRDVLRKTKVLLMPSNYESFGRCAVEAACAGIPSIVHPTLGLLESLGAEREPTREEMEAGWVSGAGIFCRRLEAPEEEGINKEESDYRNAKRVQTWKGQIERLFKDEVYYRSRSDAALKLAAKLDPEGEFDRLEEALLLTSRNWEKRNEVVAVKMWTSDRRVWETSDGKLVAEIDGRIPQNAVRMATGIGGKDISEEAAIANGLIPAPEVKEELTDEIKEEAKAISGPEENKAIQSPEQTKKKGRKKVA